MAPAIGSIAMGTRMWVKAMVTPGRPSNVSGSLIRPSESSAEFRIPAGVRIAFQA